jgi:hypothetical protein
MLEDRDDSVGGEIKIAVRVGGVPRDSNPAKVNQNAESVDQAIRCILGQGRVVTWECRGGASALHGRQLDETHHPPQADTAGPR